MRLFPEVKPPRRVWSARIRAAAFGVVIAAAGLSAAPAFAQYYPGQAPQGYYPQAQGYYPQAQGYYPQAQGYYPQTQGYQPYPQQTQPATQQQNQNQTPQNSSNATSATPAAPVDLGSVSDPNSIAYKANRLAVQAQQQRSENATLDQQSLTAQEGLGQGNPPPDLMQLQEVQKYQSAGSGSISDAPVDTNDLSLDVRRQAQREAALSYGARGGLAKRNFEIMEQMRGFSKALDRVFNFRALLIRAPSGLLIEPPIVSESDKALVIADHGDEAAVADRVYDINQQAKIVTAPRDWRQYLVHSWSNVPPPPRVLWPKTPQEQADWSVWVQEGWAAGVKQANQMFEDNVNQLVADFDGMVRYRILLAQNMITAPYAMQEDRGVTGNASQMRIGDSAVRITDPSQFLKKANLWKPADQ